MIDPQGNSALLLLSIVMIWGNSSDWGKVKMQRINFTYANDTSEYIGSALLFSPKTATANNQVPGIVVLGRRVLLFLRLESLWH